MYHTRARNTIEKTIMANEKLYTKTLTLPNGKRKYIRAKTKEEVERKYAELCAEIGAGVNVSDNSTVGELAQMWYSVYKKPHLKKGGQNAAKNAVNNHILPIIGAMKVRDVRPVNIRRVMANLEGMSQSTHDKVRQALKGMFKAAVENGMIAKSPVPDDLGKTGKAAAEVVPLTVAQSKQLLTAVKDTRAYICVILMMVGGLRREEACGLMWQDIDFTEGTITVNRVLVFYDNVGHFTEDLKSKAAHRTIPMPRYAMDALAAEKAKSNSLYVLSKTDGSLLSSTAFRHIWSAITVRETDNSALLGKPVSATHPDVKYGMDFHVHPHQLRHTAITRWFDAGLDVKTVQYLAGHSSPNVTLKIYDHYCASARQQNTAAIIQGSAVLSSIAAG